MDHLAVRTVRAPAGRRTIHPRRLADPGGGGVGQRGDAVAGDDGRGVVAALRRAAEDHVTESTANGVTTGYICSSK